MKKLIIVLASSTLLIGCATKTVVVEKTTVPDTIPATDKTSYWEEKYISNVTKMYPNLINNLGRKWLIDYANTTCEEIDNGMTLVDLTEMTVNNNLDVEMIGFLTGEAIRNFCPRNQWFIDAAAQA